MSGPPVPGGALRVRGGRICDLGPAARVGRRAGDRVVDLPGAALAPGLVNAHAHLELSGLEGRLPPAPFLAWIGGMMAARRARPAPDYAAAAREGARRLLADGTTAVGDFATGPWSLDAVAAEGMAGVVYRELVGPDPAAAPALAERARAWRCAPAPAGIRRGVAPHAPYSASRELLVRLAGAAPLAIHAAELAEEADLVERGEGPLAAFLRGRGLPAPPPRGMRPLPYLAACGILGPGSLAVHANYLDDGDVACLADSGASVVFCPGSHAFFGHRDHPLPRLLAAGVAVALGTDSLASNDALSMRREMRRAAEAFPGLPPERILEMATLGGARALGMAHEAGSLELGKRADLLAVALPAGRDPVEALVLGEPEVLGVWRGGRG